MNGLESRDADAAAVATKPRVTLDQIKTLIAGGNGTLSTAR
jgi:hypothetical protein